MLKGSSRIKRPMRTLGLRHCRGIEDNIPMMEAGAIRRSKCQLVDAVAIFTKEVLSVAVTVLS